MTDVRFRCLSIQTSSQGHQRTRPRPRRYSKTILLLRQTLQPKLRPQTSPNSRHRDPPRPLQHQSHRSSRPSVRVLHADTIDLVAKHISLNLAEKSAQHMLYLESLAKEVHHNEPLPESIVVLEQTNQLKAMTTMIRDKDCDREDFVFYLERTSSLVLERSLPH